MTTIAYRDGVMASDSDSGRGDYRCAGAMRKLFRTREGVCAMTGTAAAAMPLVEWLCANSPEGEMPTVDEKASVIHIKADGAIEIHEEGGVMHPTFEFMAWGSGMGAALGALYAGKSAVEAVEIACKVDPWSGGDIVSMPIA